LIPPPIDGDDGIRHLSEVFMLSPLDTRPHAYYRSAIGTIEVIGDERGLTSVRFVEIEPPTDNVPSVLGEAIRQLDEYFRGERTTFSLPLAPEGTAFERSVWEKLGEIAYGETRTYMEIAVDLGNPLAVRAVGRANGNNRIWIVIPCHRVIGSNGSLTGYAGGIHRKQWLLRHESTISGRSLF
jgi:methylated-DNA-[protein]-cysteine S-methyltransferase